MEANTSDRTKLPIKSAYGKMIHSLRCAGARTLKTKSLNSFAVQATGIPMWIGEKLGMKTVVVLGAGSSADFGLPLGDALYDQALDLLNALALNWKRRSNDDPFFGYHKMVQLVESEKRFRVLRPFMESENRNGQRSIDLMPIQDVIRRMEVAPAYSLDTLALEYPESEGIFRVLCAYLITEAVRSGIEEDSHHAEKSRFHMRQIRSPSEKSKMIPNWIHLFCSMVRNQLRRDPAQKLGVVSFNYDRVFEKVATSVWESPTAKIGNFGEVFDVRYPHGKIYWEQNSVGISELNVAASKIVFAHNKSANYQDDGAHDMIQSADKLIFLGFHFSPENIDTLGLRNCEGKHVVYQNYSDNPGLDSRVDALNFNPAVRFSGSIHQAILDGVLGDLPS